ncbi:hypothetical protein [Novosphingobium album (ex Hu et al. 2023)]|nr:hypothetical protein [Novosphingobium album (ex Hu et al. 2023)]
MELSMLEWLWAWKSELQHAYVFIVFLAALRWGGAPERILAGSFAAEALAHPFYHWFAHGSVFWHHLDLGHLAIDCTFFAIFFPVALQANRVYTLWIGSAQIIAMSAHVYRFSLTEINRMAYDMMAVSPSYIQLTALGLGLAFHMSRQKKLGSYPSWRNSFSPTQVVNPKLSRAV